MATKAIVGEKVGMTQVWDDQNRAIPVTVVRVSPARVVQVKTPEKEGYSAVQVTWGTRRTSTLSKPELGHFEKAGVTPGKKLVELRLDDVSGYEVGQEILADMFEKGEMIDATAVSKGKGFAGGMKRHNFSGQGAAHGNHKHHRAPARSAPAPRPDVSSRARRWPDAWAAVRSPRPTSKCRRRRRAQPRAGEGRRARAPRRRRRASHLGEEPDEGRRCAMSDALRCAVRSRRTDPAREALGRRASSLDGAELGTVELEPTIFGIEPNMAVMHQVVKAQLAAKRSGTQSTKTRKEVRGGGNKPFSQKGTGGARQGSIRAPHYPGGGIALGPKPREYDQRTPKKMIRLALYSALSDRAGEERVALVDSFDAWSDAQDQGRRRGARARSGSRARSSWCWAATTTWPCVVSQPHPRQDHRRRRAQRLRRPRLATGSCFTDATLPDRQGEPLMRDAMSVLIRPVVSEKTYALMDNGTYVFVVDPRATKIDVRNAVEQAFNVQGHQRQHPQPQGQGAPATAAPASWARAPAPSGPSSPSKQGDSIDLFES